jgi:hypothetical protein
MRSRKRLLLATTVLATSLTALSADLAVAAPPGGGGAASGPSRSSSQFTLRREEAGGGEASVARTRARAGDCAGALPAFDAAINVTIEPTLRRDRGLCHEKLGNPFPAIDDYRAYLSARPDAPDADQIRDRLIRLNEQVGVSAQSAASFQERDESLHAGGSFSQGTQGGKASGSAGSSSSRAGARHDDAVLGAKAGEPERGYDYYAAREQIADAADSSPLRFGTGWIVGPFMMVPRYFVGSGSQSSLAFAVGATFRYAWSSSLTFISEVGFAGIGESGQPSSLGGPLLFAGFEVRLPLDTWATNNIILGVGPGYERYTIAGSKAGANVLAGRGRLGYRHVFGPTIGLEITADGGPAYFKPDGVSGQVVGVVGGALALVIGF